MDRREFLKKSCGICLVGAAAIAFPKFAMAAGAGGKVKNFSTTVDGNNQMLIPLAQFTGVSVVIVSADALQADVAVHQGTDGSYVALLLLCTHWGEDVDYTGSDYFCSAHGSTFDQNGNVLVGPATDPLARYTAQLNAAGTGVVITVPAGGNDDSNDDSFN